MLTPTVMHAISYRKIDNKNQWPATSHILWALYIV